MPAASQCAHSTTVFATCSFTAVFPPSVRGGRGKGPRPALRPLDEGQEDRQELAPERREPVALAVREIDEPALSQLPQALVEHGGADAVAGLLEPPERQARVPQLPDHAQRPAPAQQVDEGHDRATRPRPPHALPRCRRLPRLPHPGAPPIPLRYRNSSSTMLLKT